MLELAIALTLYGDNFLRNIAKASRETSSFKSVVSSLKGEESFEVLAREARRTSEEIKEIGRETEKTEKKLKGLSDVLKRVFDPKSLNQFSEKLEDITIKTGAIGGAISLGLKSVVTDAADFEKGLAEASTLVKTDFEKFKKLYSNQLLEISVELGQEQSEVTKAFYDAISSGFDPKKALQIIKVAGEAAVAGVSDISTANNTLITVMKAWGLNLKQASDYIFKTIAKGRTTFSEIARDIGGVASTIASAGIKFKEFSAIVAAATAKGLDTGQTMTSIREIVNSLIAPTSQAQKAFQQLGITVNKTTLKQKGLIGTLKEITDAMKRAGLTEAEQAQMLSEIFGSVEAQKVVNMFISDPETFIKTLKDFQSVGGETEEAFRKMSKSTAYSFERLSQAITATKIVFGNLFLPVVNSGANILMKAALTIKDFSQEHKTLTKILAYTVGTFGLLATSIAAFSAGLAFTAKALSLSVEGFNLLFSAVKFGIPLIRALTAAFLSNPILLALTGIAFAGYLIYTNWDKVKPVVLGVWNAFKGFFRGIGELIHKASSIGSSVITAFKGFGRGIETLFFKTVKSGKELVFTLAKVFLSVSPFGILLMSWKRVYSFLSSINLFSVGEKIITTIVQGVTSKAKHLYDAVRGVLSKVRNLLPFSPAKEGPLSDLHKTGTRLIETIAEGIRGDFLLTKVISLVKGVKSALLMPFQTPITAVASLLFPISNFSQPPSHYFSSRHNVQATTHFHINITVNGTASKEDGLKIARIVRREIEKYEREKREREIRVNYGIGDSYNFS